MGIGPDDLGLIGLGIHISFSIICMRYAGNFLGPWWVGCQPHWSLKGISTSLTLPPGDTSQTGGGNEEECIIFTPLKQLFKLSKLWVLFYTPANTDEGRRTSVLFQQLHLRQGAIPIIHCHQFCYKRYLSNQQVKSFFPPCILTTQGKYSGFPATLHFEGSFLGKRLGSQDFGVVS